MSTQFSPYGSAGHAATISKVGFKDKTPRSLASRMPSVEIAAKVGTPGIDHVATRRVIRRNGK